MPRRRLLWQLYPAFLAITVLSLAAVGWYASQAMRQFHLRSTEQDLRARALLLEGAVRDRLGAGNERELEVLCRELGRSANTRLTVVLPGGRVAADSDLDPADMENHAGRPEIAGALSGRTGSAVHYSATLGQDMMYVAVPVRRDGGTVAALRAAVPLTQVNRAMRAFHLHLALGGLVIAALAALVSLVAYRKLSRPLEEIRRGVERFARGDLESRIAVADPEEVGGLAEAMNRMAERLRHLERVRRDFVANVSHELRTPVTSIKGYVETLQDGAFDNPEEARRFLAIVAKHADRLGAIIQDLLLLSRIEQEAGQEPLELARVPLRDLLRSAVEDCAPQAAVKNVSIYLSCPGETTVRASAPLMEQAVVNLIDNAIKYSGPSAPVWVEAVEAGAEVVVNVRDQGCGIEAEHIPRLGERFYRVDKARSRQQGGTGLGLAIVKHIAQMHGGRLSIQSSPGQGSTFGIHLPMAMMASRL